VEDNARKIAIISYLTVIGTLVAMLMNSENRKPFASFHIRQSIGIFIIFYVTGYFIGYFDSWMISSAFWLFIFVLWLYGFLGALQSKQNLVPFLGSHFQKWFKNL
jgi:uncharacterized membrane protein